MSRFLRSIAISAGAALGSAAARGSRGASRVPVAMPTPQRGPVLVPKQETVQQRLDRLEARLAGVETLRAAVPALEMRLEAQESRFEALRSTVEEAERRAAAGLERVEKSFAGLRDELPGLVESSVSKHIGELEARLHADAETKWQQAIEQKISERLGSLEKVLMDQSASIQALRVRAEETDSNLQRLVVAVERICERGIAPAAGKAEPVSKGPGFSVPGVFGALLAFGIARLFIS